MKTKIEEAKNSIEETINEKGYEVSIEVDAHYREKLITILRREKIKYKEEGDEIIYSTTPKIHIRIEKLLAEEGLELESASILEETLNELDPRIQDELEEIFYERVVEAVQWTRDQDKNTIYNLLSEKINERVTSELTETQKEKFAEKISDVTFVNETDYEEQITVIRDKYFSLLEERSKVQHWKDDTAEKKKSRLQRYVNALSSTTTI